MKVVVHVDGGSRGNPGPAAAAAVVSTVDGDVIDEAVRVPRARDQQRRRVPRPILGLDRAKAVGATEIELYNDSELVAHQINGRYKVKHPDMKPLYLDAMERLREFGRWRAVGPRRRTPPPTRSSTRRSTRAR